MVALLLENLRQRWEEWKRRDVTNEVWARLRAIWKGASDESDD